MIANTYDFVWYDKKRDIYYSFARFKKVGIYEDGTKAYFYKNENLLLRDIEEVITFYEYIIKGVKS